ncbi:TetR/AcrR family transcriptional regulator [Bacillus sp. NEB1478]|uniref:TetR/AcrR family transcriptional regulator n=1 Tax=Bacillus sp. NEB1478 TaxID=3073816 RepID=UPI002873428E|nr:TetR/AcrR family transcriptional regulator [Bacillus sp. NEB1478]WNB92125.1 TetR/AcrR family transcriptional regulator [Bacillus sp. NEB1478]
MSKGKETRKMILRKSAVIFNQQGFTGSSMSDIMNATGLEKGGIYRHFKNKDELALEAFEYAIGVLRDRYRAAIAGNKSAEDKLISVLSVYSNIDKEPPLEGGCPLLNTAIDTDDTHPLLHKRAQEAMNEWLRFLKSILKEGIVSGEFRPDLNIEDAAIFLSSAFEGNIMMGKLFNNSVYVQKYINQLKQYIELCIKK